MSSSAVPPKGLPRRGVPGSTAPAPAQGTTGAAPAQGQPLAESTWPLPRNAAPPTGKRNRKPEPDAAPPPEEAAGLPKTAAQTGEPAKLRVFPSEKGNPRPPAPGRATETTGEIPILQPAALNPRQTKNTGKVPPLMATTKSEPEKPVDGFSFSKPLAPKNGKADPDLPKPLRTGPSGPVPPPQNPNRLAASQQPPIPESLRPGPPGSAPRMPETSRPGPSPVPPPRAGQSVPDPLRPGMGRQGQKPAPGFFPKQPGPAPSVPVPTPTKSPPPKNNPGNGLPGDQGNPPPLRVGNLPPAQQRAGAAPNVSSKPPGLDPNQARVPPPASGPLSSADPSRPRMGGGSIPGANPAASGSLPRKPVNQTPLGSSPPRPPVQTGEPPEPLRLGNNPLRQFPPNPSLKQQQGGPAPTNPLSPPPNAPPQQGNAAYTAPPKSQPLNASAQQGNPASTNPFKPTPPNPRMQPGNLSPPGNQPGPNPSVYRPSMTSPPPRRQDTTSFAPPPVASPPRRAPSSSRPPPRVTSPREFSGARPAPTYAGPSHGHSHSLGSNASNDSTASSATATSTRPLNQGIQRQNTGARQQSSDPREKGTPGGGGYYHGASDSPSGQTPYMNMLLSLDRIPRMHNILVAVFVWVLLAGFVIIPGCFTSARNKQEGEDTVQIPVGAGGADGKKLSLTPANTAAMVIGFVCIVAGLFGSAWLALRWRRNYVWLLNKLYLPLVLNALAGLLATLTSVYTQQGGEWSPQAIVAAIVEGSVLVLSAILFFVYNYWLLQRVKNDHEEAATTSEWEKDEKKEKKEKKGRRWRAKKKGGFLARFRRASKKRPIAAGSVV